MRPWTIFGLAGILATILVAPPESALALPAEVSGTELLSSLVVAESSELGYDRSSFQHWVDADGNGCDTRQEVLISESLVTPVIGPDCSILSGEWFSWFDGVTWTNPSDVDIDHFVPLQEAWRSGAYGWTASQRRNFANDLTLTDSLVAVTDSVNSAKGSRDPSAWLPPALETECRYALEWVTVKYRWHLMVDVAEKAALDRLVSGECGARLVSVPPDGGTPAAGSTMPLTTGVSRISGADRYQTAVAISAAYPVGVDVVYVATGENYPDALSAAPAAAKQGGPLLLTARGSLPAAVQQEIVRLKPGRIVVVGGENAVARTVSDQLQRLAPTSRAAGADRFETSRIVTREAFAEDGSSIAYVATGNNFPDALSASAAAGSLGSPVILVNGAGGNVEAATLRLIADLGVATIRIAGGIAVVAPEVESSLAGAVGVVAVERLAGADRYDTSVAINQAAFVAASTTYLAVGTGFADALAGAALAGLNGAPLYIVPSHCVPDRTLAAVQSSGNVRIVLLGGENALGSGVANLVPCSAIPAPAPPATAPTPPIPSVPPTPAPNVYDGTVTPGAFCKFANIGWIGYTSRGTKMVCSSVNGDSPRWRSA